MPRDTKFQFNGVELCREDFPDTIKGWVAFNIAFLSNTYSSEKQRLLVVLLAEAERIVNQVEYGSPTKPGTNAHANMRQSFDLAPKNTPAVPAAGGNLRGVADALDCVSMVLTALDYLADRGLPNKGWCVFHNGEPMGWEMQVPEPAKYVAGVLLIDVRGGELLEATGGNNDDGAEKWQAVNPSGGLEPDPPKKDWLANIFDRKMLVRQHCKDHAHPNHGVLIFRDGNPHAWASQKPRCTSLMTGTIVVEVISGRMWQAVGPGPKFYANRWEQVAEGGAS